MLSQEPVVNSSFWNRYPQEENLQKIKPCQVQLFRIPRHLADRLELSKSLRLSNASLPLSSALEKEVGDLKDSTCKTQDSMSFTQIQEHNIVQRPNCVMYLSETDAESFDFPAADGKAGNTLSGSTKTLKEDGNEYHRHLSACRVPRKGCGAHTSKTSARLFPGLQDFPLTDNEFLSSPTRREDALVPCTLNARCKKTEHKSTNIFDALSQSSDKACEIVGDDVSLVCSWALKSSCFLKNCEPSAKDSFQSQPDQSHSKMVDMLCSTDAKEYEANMPSQASVQDIDCTSSESLRFYDMLLSSDEASNDSTTETQDTRLLSVNDNKDILSDVLDKVFFGDENSASSSKGSGGPRALQWQLNPSSEDHYKYDLSENSTELEEINFTNVLNSLGDYSTDCRRPIEHENVANVVDDLVSNVCHFAEDSTANLQKCTVPYVDVNITHPIAPHFYSGAKTDACPLLHEIENSVKDLMQEMLAAVPTIVELNCPNEHYDNNQKCFTASDDTVESEVARLHCGDDNMVDEYHYVNNKCRNSPEYLPDCTIVRPESHEKKLCYVPKLADIDSIHHDNVKQIVTKKTVAMSPDSSSAQTTNSATVTTPNTAPSPENLKAKKSQQCKRKLDTRQYSVKECDETSHTSNESTKQVKVPKLLIVKDAGSASDTSKKFISKIVNDKCMKSSLKMSIKKIPKMANQVSKRALSNKTCRDTTLKQVKQRMELPQSSKELKTLANEKPKLLYDPYNFEIEDEYSKSSENLEVPRLLHLPLCRSPSPSLLCYANIDSNHVIKSVNLEQSEGDETRQNSPVDSQNGVENLMKYLVTNVQDATVCWKNRYNGSLKPITEDMLEEMADELGREFEFDQEDIESFKQSAKNILTMVETVHQKKRRKWSRGCIEKRKPKVQCKEKEVAAEKDGKEKEVATEKDDKELPPDPLDAPPPLTPQMVVQQEPEDEELSQISGMDSIRGKSSVTPSPSLSSLDNEPENSQDSCYFDNHCKPFTRTRRKRTSAADLEGMLTRMRSLRNRGGDDVISVDFDDPIPLEYKERRKKRHHRKNNKNYGDESTASFCAPQIEPEEIQQTEPPLIVPEQAELPPLNNESKSDYCGELEPTKSEELPNEVSPDMTFLGYQKKGSSRHTWLSSRWRLKKRKRMPSDDEYPQDCHTGETEIENTDTESLTQNVEKTLKKVEELLSKAEQSYTSVETKSTEVANDTSTDQELQQEATSESAIVAPPQDDTFEILTENTTETADPDCSSPVATAKECPLDLSQWTNEQATSTVEVQENASPSSSKADDRPVSPSMEDYADGDLQLPIDIVSSTSKNESNSTAEACMDEFPMPMITEEVNNDHLSHTEDECSCRSQSPASPMEIIDVESDADASKLPRITSVVSLANSESESDNCFIIEKSLPEEAPKLSAFHSVQSADATLRKGVCTPPPQESSRPGSVNNAGASEEIPVARTPPQQLNPLAFPLSMTKDMFNAQYDRLRTELMTLELIARQKEKERNDIIRLKLYKQSVMRKLQIKKALMQHQMHLQAQHLMSSAPSCTATEQSASKQTLRYPVIAPKLFPAPLAPNCYLAAAGSDTMQMQAKQVPTVSSSQQSLAHVKQTADKKDKMEQAKAIHENLAASIPQKVHPQVHGEQDSVPRSSPSTSSPADTESKFDNSKPGKNDPNSSLSSVETIVAKANENFGLQFQGWMEDSQRIFHPYYKHAVLAATAGQSPVQLDASSKSILETSLQTASHGQTLPLYATGFLATAADKRNSKSLDDAIRNVYSRKFNCVSSLAPFVPGFPMTALYSQPMVVPTIGVSGLAPKNYPATSTATTSDFNNPEPTRAPKKQDSDVSTSTPFQHSTLAKLLLSPLPDSKSHKDTLQRDPNNPAGITANRSSPLLTTGKVLPTTSTSASTSPWKPVDRNAVKWPMCTSCKHMYARFICAGCNSQWYCSETCQVRDWKYHFKSCRRV